MLANLPRMKVVETYQITPRILIVDDDLYNREVLKRVFMRHAEMVEAKNGQEALDWLARENFDIVLLDVMMPDISGIDVLKTIRSKPEWSDLPVILITALSENEDMVYGLQCGANDYILKPIDIDVVLARVDTQLMMKFMTDVYKQSIIELEAAQKMKDRLFCIASHDLKSPLANIKMAEYLLRGLIQDQPAALEILDTVESTVRHMKGVIEDFLDFAAHESGSIELRLESLPVQEPILEVVSQHAMKASDKGITLDMGELAGIVSADRARLEQAISNLICNAIKYSPHHTVVTIWTETIENSVHIFVADQGPGIPLNEQGRLFTEFGKLSNRPTGNESSTGLGLWIVKHMIHLQNGSVGVECPADGGSIFWIELPALKA